MVNCYADFRILAYSENADFRVFNKTPVARRAKQYLIEHFSINVGAYDLIIGYRADDSYFDYAESFVNNGISVDQLARRSGVSLRSIQMYEQRNKDINKASAETLYRLARVFGCRMEDLLEK